MDTNQDPRINETDETLEHRGGDILSKSDDTPRQWVEGELRQRPDSSTYWVERLVSRWGESIGRDPWAHVSEVRPSTPVFKVGDGASYSVGSDVKACTVVKISASGKTMWLQEDTATLLNGVDSNELDALQFSPGGFMGHTSGVQRYSYMPDATGSVTRVSLRTRADGSQVWKRAGSPVTSWDSVFPGRHAHYDYNC